MKYKRIILILSIFILFSIASVSASEVDEKAMMSDGNLEIESTSIEHDLKTTKDSQVLSKANDNEIQILKDNGIAGNDIDSNTNATFEDLRSEIEQGEGNITLKHKFYNYNGAGQGPEFININVPNSIIDGNGAVIDMKGSSTQAFHINSENITVKNLTIKNACRDTWGLGFYITGNDAKILDCNFIDNNGQTKGVIYFDNVNGAVTNCTFINNIADTYSWGGTIFNANGLVTVTNCYFSGNYAQEGSDIYSETYPVTADTCIFKDTGTTYNVDIVPPTLNVDDFITLNNSGEKLTFDLKTKGGMPVDNGNISISVYDKNDSLIGEYSCLSGEGWAVDLPVGTYYAIFNTEYAGFEAINRTITVIPNIEYYINITPVTTSNKTVNITAKSNIPTDIIGGRLVFILPNGNKINGTYDSNGTWMAVHTFDKYGTYEINATYTNFKIMTVNSANITVRKTNSTIYLDDIVLDYHESELITVATEGATSITAKIDENPVKIVDNFTISISDLDAGNYTLTVTTVPDETHITVTKTVNLTINKLPTKIIANDMELKSGDETKLVYVLLPENAKGQIYFESDNPYVVSITSDGNLTAASTGTANITITFTGNKNYEKTTKTINIKVDKTDSTLIIPTQELTYKPSLNLTVYTEGTTGITAKINNKDAKVNGYTIEIPEDTGKYTLTVTTIPDETHNPVTKTVNLTINKAPTEIAANDLELTSGDKTKLNYLLLPEDAKGDVRFISHDTNIVYADAETGIIVGRGEGTATVTVTYFGNDNYEPSTTNVTVTVNKIPTEITAEGCELYVGDNATISYKLIPEDAEGDVRFMSNDTNIVYADAETGIIVARSAGTATVTVSYFGNDKYESSTTNVTVNVNKLTSVVSAEDITVNLGDPNGKFIATLTNAEGIPLSANIVINLNGVDYAMKTNSKGHGVVSTANLAPGEYTATVTYKGNSRYNPSNTTAKVTVKLVSVVSADDVSVKVGDASGKFVATLTNAEGTPLSANIVINLNGIDYAMKTDSKGHGVVSTANLTPGEYTATVTYKGNSRYGPSNTTAKVTVNKLDSVVSAEDVSVNLGDEKGKFIATLTNAEGIPLSANVYVTLNGVTYAQKSNSKGHVVIPTANLDMGEYVATVVYKGNSRYNPSNTTAKVTVKLGCVVSAEDVIVKAGDANGKFIATLTNLEGIPLSANVVVTINGVKYSQKSNSKGQVIIPTADLEEGEYIATVEYKGNSRYNPSSTTAKITVNNKFVSVVTADDVFVQASDPNSKFIAKLTNESGNPLSANMIVTLNGVTYAMKSNSQGQVIIPTEDLEEGEYIATVEYKGNSKYNPSSTTAKVVVNNKLTSCISGTYNTETQEVIGTLTNSAGTPLNANVVVNLNGVNYAMKSNSKGQFKVSTADLAPGKYVAKLVYKGNSKYNPSSTTVNVVIP
ncbi:Ig-like domain-containing protein [Methanobrevibacter sp.]|uniref:Ig-like domain-containing protein n=1 Tax=Methanobrevibacter sp. TaxID=66852 RepID=UPI00386AD1B8